ncbi:MAG: hypothetical protein ACM34A_12210 [Bacillota bacterium]
MASLMPTGKQQFFDTPSGRPLAGGKLYTYAAGTTTPKATFSDAAGTTKNTNPVILDSRGEALIFWAGSYDILLKDANDNLIYSVQNYVTDAAAAVLSQLSASSGASVVGFIQDGTGAVAEDLQKNARKWVYLSSYGGTPSASAAAKITAFTNAFNKLKGMGGGVLVVEPGTYDLGEYASSVSAVEFTGLANVLILAYGAYFTCNTTTNSRPRMFKFIDPDNITIAGARFYDAGGDPSVWTIPDHKGAFAVSIQAQTKNCYGVRLVDVYGENLDALLVNDQQSYMSYRIDSVEVHGRVKTCYYGVSSDYPGKNWKVNIDCEDVRRGFIAYAPNNFDVDLNLKCNAGFFGSNAFVSIACAGNSLGNPENGRVKLRVSGVESHTGLVHFYHQQDESAGYMRNIAVDVEITNLTTAGKNASVGPTNVFIFDHENSSGVVNGTTNRVWDGIRLSGNIIGSVSGSILSLPTTPASPGALELSPSVAALVNLGGNVSNFFNLKTPYYGTFSPVIVGDTTAGAGTYTLQKGVYSVDPVQKRCFGNLSIAWSAHTGTGNLRIDNLPLAIDTTNISSASVAITHNNLSYTSGNTVSGLIGGSANKQVIIYQSGPGVGISAVPMDTAATLHVTFSYPYA